MEFVKIIERCNGRGLWNYRSSGSLELRRLIDTYYAMQRLETKCGNLENIYLLFTTVTTFCNHGYRK